MKKPHIISKEDFSNLDHSVTLASDWPTKRLSAKISLLTNRLYYSLDFRTVDDIPVQTNYQTFDEAIEAYNNV